MNYHFKLFAVKDNGFKLGIHAKSMKFDRLDELKAEMLNAYADIMERTNHELTGDIKHEAMTHAYALWVACDKMQVINRVEDTRYVLEVTVENG